VPEKRASDPDFKTESLPFVVRDEVCNLTCVRKYNYKNDVCAYIYVYI